MADTMDGINEVKTLLTEQKTVWAQLQGELKKLDDRGVNTQVEWNETTQKLQTRLDEIEVKLQRPVFGETKETETAEAAKHAFEHKAFSKALRRGEQQLTAEERKALATDSDPDGGFTVPVTRSNEIIKKLIQFSPVRELASVITLTQGDTYEEPGEGSTDFAADWVGERSSRPETTSGTLRLEKIPTHEQYAQPYITQKMLDDAGFDVEGWVADRVSMRFAVLEGLSFVSGSGVGRPEGLLTRSGITEVNTGHASTLLADGLMDLVYGLPEFYCRNASFLLKRSTIQAVRKLKDGSGQYMWNPGFSGALSMNQPASILGFPYREAVDMPAVSAGLYPIIFGDFKLAYRVVDRLGMRVLRDPYSNKPHVAFYTTRRVGGQVVLGEAIIKQKVSA